MLPDDAAGRIRQIGDIQFGHEALVGRGIGQVSLHKRQRLRAGMQKILRQLDHPAILTMHNLLMQ